MSVYRTLTIAGFVALSGTSALAEDGRENQAIRDDIYYNGQNYSPAPVPLVGGPVLMEGRASVVGPAPVREGVGDLEAAPPLNPRYDYGHPSRRY